MTSRLRLVYSPYFYNFCHFQITELESNYQSRSRAQLAALEARVQYQEEQLASESSERANATRATRRLEKRLHDSMLQLEDERRTVEQQKEIVSFCTFKVYSSLFRPRRVTFEQKHCVASWTSWKRR